MLCSRFDVADIIAKRDWASLREAMSGLRVPDIADLLADLDEPNRVLLFRSLPRKTAADVFAELEKEDRDALLLELTGEETRHLMANIRPDDRTELLEELPGRVTQRLMNLLSPEDLKEARELLGYPEESIGRLMTPDYVAIRPDWTVAQAVEHIRKKGKDSETIDAVYVTDRAWKLIGVLSLRQIVLAPRDEKVVNIMRTQVVSLPAAEDREAAARTMERYDLFVLPVVDSDGVLVGIVTGDDIFEVAREEATEDFHKGAAVTPLKTGFGEAGIGLLFKSRIGWLIMLILVDLLSAATMARFENVIAQVMPLVFFIPLLIGCAGNAGSQSSTLVVRELALGQVDTSDWLELVIKEMGISAALGLTISLAVWGPAVLRGGSGVGIVVALSATAIVMIGSVVGMAAPFLLNKMGFDPAAASSPLITSIADVAGVLVYFTVAVKVLKL